MAINIKSSRLQTGKPGASDLPDLTPGVGPANGNDLSHSRNTAESIADAHPLNELIGSHKDDVYWDILMTAIRDNRREEDERENAAASGK